MSVTRRIIKQHVSNNESNVELESTMPSTSPISTNWAFRFEIKLILELLFDLFSRVLRILPIVKHLVGPPNETEQVIESLTAQQKVAISYEEWDQLALKLDRISGNEVWKENPISNLYDYKLISLRLHQLRYTREAKNYKKLLYLIRTTWTRNIGNIQNVNLYRHSMVGTKNLIEEYLEECKLSLDCLLNDQLDTGIDDRYLLGMLIQTRKAIGRTALVLSGGGCFGLFHIGVLATLLEQNLLPRIVSGSSAGAIVASILLVHNPEEIDGLLSDILSREFVIFTDPEAFDIDDKSKKKSVLVNLLQFLKTGTWFDNAYLISTMRHFLGDLTFREAYNRTGRILNVTVSPVSFHEQPSLLNYITSPNVLIWSAVCASCALPGVFPSTILYEKDPATGKSREWNHISVKFVDGSVDNDLPITRLSEMFNVDHIIACQVNPHVAPFLKLSLAAVGGEIENESSAIFKSYFSAVYNCLTAEVIHYLDLGRELGIARNLSKKIKSVLTQRYSGDITILPQLRITELNKILVNPTPEFVLDTTVRGARSTWPKISMIKNHCFTEFLLDESISYLRSRLITNRVNVSGFPMTLVNCPVNSDDQDTGSDEDIKHTDYNDDDKSQREYQGGSSVTRSTSHGSFRKINPQTFGHLRKQNSISVITGPSSSGSSSSSNNSSSTSPLRLRFSRHNSLNDSRSSGSRSTILKYYSMNSLSSILNSPKDKGKRMRG